MINTGKHENYWWIERSGYSLNFVKNIIDAHRGLFLHITSFDSGPISPTEKEVKEGWTISGIAMVSPRLDASFEIPYDNYDEWLFFNEKMELKFDIEVFVNYTGFSLLPVDEQLGEFDLTWERDKLDWLQQLQDKFWMQLKKLNPETYVAMGDRDIVVSKKRSCLSF